MILYELDTHLEFGKYFGRTLIDIASENAMYIEWCINNVNYFVINDLAVEEIKKIYPKFLTAENSIINLKYKQKKWEEYVEIESKKNYDNDNSDYESESSNWDNEFYNDSLDTDQQSPEWWDSL